MPTETPTIVPNIPKARPRTLPWKYCWSIPTPCGLSSPGAHAHDDAGDVEDQRVGREPGDEGSEREDADAEDEEPAPAEEVTGTARRDEEHPEGQRVAGEHPLDRRVRGADRALHIGQDDVDDQETLSSDMNIGTSITARILRCSAVMTVSEVLPIHIVLRRPTDKHNRSPWCVCSRATETDVSDGVGRAYSPLPMASAALGSDERRNSSMRAASSPSPIAPAARPSA